MQPRIPEGTLRPATCLLGPVHEVLEDGARSFLLDPLLLRSRTGFIAILATTLSVAAIGVVAIMHGEADDAPDLVPLGMLLIVGAFALGVRTAQRTRWHPQPPGGKATPPGRGSGPGSNDQCGRDPQLVVAADNGRYVYVWVVR